MTSCGPECPFCASGATNSDSPVMFRCICICVFGYLTKSLLSKCYNAASKFPCHVLQYLCLCICVFVYLCICVFMYLCIWVFECFWHKEIHLVRLGDLGQLTEDWVARSGEKAAAVRVPRYMRREGALYCIYLYIYQSLFKLSSDLSASLEVQVSIAVWYKIQSAANHTFTFSVVPSSTSVTSVTQDHFYSINAS